MNRENATGTGGGGIGLFTIFLILKLTGLIDWSWWWITAPLWIPVIIILIVLGILVIVNS